MSPGIPARGTLGLSPPSARLSRARVAGWGLTRELETLRPRHPERSQRGPHKRLAGMAVAQLSLGHVKGREDLDKKVRGGDGHVG